MIICTDDYYRLYKCYDFLYFITNIWTENSAWILRTFGELNKDFLNIFKTTTTDNIIQFYFYKEILLGNFMLSKHSTYFHFLLLISKLPVFLTVTLS